MIENKKMQVAKVWRNKKVKKRKKTIQKHLSGI